MPKQQDGSKQSTKVDKPEMDIHTAIMSDNLEIVKQHIEAGTDINQKDALSGSTPLISAAMFGKTDIAKALIDAGADLTLKIMMGLQPCILRHSCRVEIVQMLIDAKADKTAKKTMEQLQEKPLWDHLPISSPSMK